MIASLAPTDLLSWAVGILAALIAASGSLLAYREGHKQATRASEDRRRGEDDRRRSTALEGFDDLTTQLRNQVSEQQRRIDEMQVQVNDCVRDRNDLRQEVAWLRGRIDAIAVLGELTDPALVSKLIKQLQLTQVREPGTPA